MGKPNINKAIKKIFEQHKKQLTLKNVSELLDKEHGLTTTTLLSRLISMLRSGYLIRKKVGKDTYKYRVKVR